MQKNIILAGVGGQGILTIAYVLDNSAKELGLSFKQAEVHGMAQRGGAVQSHLRFSDEALASDLVPLGKGDLILSVEPLEALRYLQYLSPKGDVVTSSVPFVNIPNYPELDEVLAKLDELPSCVLVDSKTLASKAGSGRAQNVVMIGAAAPSLGFPEAVLEKYIETLFARKGVKIVKANLRAFRYGLRVGQAFRRCRAAGLSTRRAHALLQALDPAGLEDAAQVDPWLALLKGPQGEALAEALMTKKGSVNPDSSGTELLS